MLQEVWYMFCNIKLNLSCMEFRQTKMKLHDP